MQDFRKHSRSHAANSVAHDCTLLKTVFLAPPLVGILFQVVSFERFQQLRSLE